MRRLTVFAPLFAVAVLLAQADRYYEGLAAYERGDYEVAFRLWGPLAKEGDAESQYRLGRLFETGLGVEQSDGEAVAWYRRAADQGHARAQNNLGLLYDIGRGVPEDNVEAVKWYRLAAEQGRAVAQNNLASMYERGEGVAQELDEAARWYRSAANRGHTGAQVALAALYEEGGGVPRDEAKAAGWYRKAAKRGHAEAQHKLATLYEQGRGVPQDRENAVKWYQRAAGLGWAEAQQRLEDLARGRPPENTPTAPPSTGATVPPIVEADPAPDALPATREAVATGSSADRWQTLAEGGDAEAQYQLARMYGSGEVVEQDPAKAEQWLVAAAVQGHEMATYRLGFLYLRGQGASGRPDLIQAYAWFSVAAKERIGDAAKWRDKTVRKMTAEELSASKALLPTIRPAD